MDLDDCVLAIGHTDADGGHLVVDLVARQSGERGNGTYNPLLAVAKGGGYKPRS